MDKILVVLVMLPCNSKYPKRGYFGFSIFLHFGSEFISFQLNLLTPTNIVEVCIGLTWNWSQLIERVAHHLVVLYPPSTFEFGSVSQSATKLRLIKFQSPGIELSHTAMNSQEQKPLPMSDWIVDQIQFTPLPEMVLAEDTFIFTLASPLSTYSLIQRILHSAVLV